MVRLAVLDSRVNMWMTEQHISSNLSARLFHSVACGAKDDASSEMLHHFFCGHCHVGQNVNIFSAISFDINIELTKSNPWRCSSTLSCPNYTTQWIFRVVHIHHFVSSTGECDN